MAPITEMTKNPPTAEEKCPCFCSCSRCVFN